MKELNPKKVSSSVQIGYIGKEATQNYISISRH